MKAKGKLRFHLDQLREQTRPIQMLWRLRALFLGAGAGIENLVQLACSGLSLVLPDSIERP